MVNLTLQDAFKALEEIEDKIEVTSEAHRPVNESIDKSNHKASLKEGPNTTAQCILYDGETCLATRGFTSLIKCSNGNYVTKYAPGYFTGVINAKSDEEAKKKFFELQDALGELNEAEDRDRLDTKFDSRKSFYGKAETEVKDDGTKVLYSYDTPVCEIRDGKVNLLSGALPQTKGYKVALWRYSPTTLRHTKEFLKQNGFKADSVSQMEKDYLDENLKESVEINLNDDKSVEAGKEELKKEAEKNAVSEQIVDADASTIDELKDSYIGSAILRCPVCHTLVYKKLDGLKKDNGELYNADEECTHCGSTGGFELVGQVASMDAEKDDAKKDSSELDLDIDTSANKTASADNDSVELENLDEKRFDKLVNMYVNEIYENVDKYTTKAGYVDKNNKLVVEGVIKYKSGKVVDTRFMFDAPVATKNGALRLRCMNESFTKAHSPFTFIGHMSEDKNIVCESLRYRYIVNVNNEDRLVRGRVALRN